MKKCLTLALAVVLLLTACGCGRYSSKYFAVGFVHSNEAHNAFMSFHSFEGTMVFKLSTGNGKIRYSAELEEGSATVYYDSGREKTPVFTIGPGESTGPALAQTGPGRVYVIVETDGKCMNGNFSFEAV